MNFHGFEQSVGISYFAPIIFSMEKPLTNILVQSQRKDSHILSVHKSTMFYMTSSYNMQILCIFLAIMGQLYDMLHIICYILYVYSHWTYNEDHLNRKTSRYIFYSSIIELFLISSIALVSLVLFAPWSRHIIDYSFLCLVGHMSHFSLSLDKGKCIMLSFLVS